MYVFLHYMTPYLTYLYIIIYNRRINTELTKWIKNQDFQEFQT